MEHFGLNSHFPMAPFICQVYVCALYPKVICPKYYKNMFWETEVITCVLAYFYPKKYTKKPYPSIFLKIKFDACVALKNQFGNCMLQFKNPVELDFSNWKFQIQV